MLGKNNHMPVEVSTNSQVENYAGLEGRQLIATVYRDFGKRVAVLSSFGSESAVLLHMISEVSTDIPVIFLDTLKLFPETLAYRDKLTEELGLTDLRAVMPDASDVRTEDAEGDLNQYNKDACCNIRKTLPMQKAMTNFDAIISGRKRFHGALRSNLQFVNVQDRKLKIEPLAAFSSLDLHSYMQHHHLPSHPLKLEGYRSIGCMPCTARAGTDDDPRAGRWSGLAKTECGIHFMANGKPVRPLHIGVSHA
jgi:phosphoadenosine phosphosulfate reductase